MAISIRDDDVVEQRESFIVTLKGPSDLNDGVSLSPTHRIIISDDDSESKLTKV